MKIHLLLISVVLFSAGMNYSAQAPKKPASKPTTLTDLPQLPLANIAKYLNNSGLAGLVRASRMPHDYLQETLTSRSLRGYWTTGKIKEIAFKAEEIPHYPHIAFSHDGTRLASAGINDHYINASAIILWDVIKGEKIKGRNVHGVVRSIAFSPDGNLLACGLDDGTVKLWNLQSNHIRILSGHTQPVYSLAFSANGKLLASGSQDKTIRIWDVQQGKEINKLTGHTNWVRSISFSPDGTLLVSAGSDSIRLWNVRTGKGVPLVGKEIASNILVMFLPSGKLVAAGNSVMSWKRQDLVDPQTLGEYPEGMLNEPIALFHMRTAYRKTRLGYISSYDPLALSPDGTLLVSGSSNVNLPVATITYRNVQTGKEIFVIKLPRYTWAVSSLAFSPNGKLLAIGCDKGYIRIYEAVHQEQPQ